MGHFYNRSSLWLQNFRAVISSLCSAGSWGWRVCGQWLRKTLCCLSNLQMWNFFALTCTGKCIDMKTSKQLESPAVMKRMLFLLDLCERFIQTKTFYHSLLPLPLPCVSSPRQQWECWTPLWRQARWAVLRAAPLLWQSQTAPPAWEDLHFSVVSFKQSTAEWSIREMMLRILSTTLI